MSQIDLAARLGITYQQVQKYEAGANRIAVSMLMKIAEAFGDPVGALLPVGNGGAETLDIAVAEFVHHPSTAAMVRGWARLSPQQQADIAQLVLSLGEQNANRRR